MASPLAPLPPNFAPTVASLHRVAERLVAPARKPDNEISLRATPGGFGTPAFELDGTTRQVRIEGAELVHAPRAVDPAAARALAEWYAFGERSLDRLVALAAPASYGGRVASTGPR